MGAKTLILGIDPGIHGAYAVLDLAKDGDIIYISNIPTYKTDSKSRKSGYLEHIDCSALAAALEVFAPNVLTAFIEEPNTRPGQAAGATFRFGKFCGQIHGILAGLNIPTKGIKPSLWKQSMGLSSDKYASMRLATEYFPQHKHHWKLKKHNDLAEAALIGLFGISFLTQIGKEL